MNEDLFLAVPAMNSCNRTRGVFISDGLRAAVLAGTAMGRAAPD